MTEPTTARRRAPGMSPDERRAMIVAAALPLVAEFGAAVTTSQIARAAGIGEATIFRVFDDKDAVLDACVIEALNPDHVLRELASVALDRPLHVRLTDAADALGAHLRRVGAVLGSLHSSGHRRPRDPGHQPPAGGRDASMHAVHQAVTELIEPDQDTLRLPPGAVASIFLHMLYARQRTPSGDASIAPEDLVSVLLHGAETRN